MGRINKANLKKTIYYMKRNGIRRTWYAVLERLEERKRPPYVWTPPADRELEAQRRGWQRQGLCARFSILVPTYRTKPEYLKELVESLRCQTYPGWELILADATEDCSVERALRDMTEPGQVDFEGGGQGTGDLTDAPGRSAGDAAPGISAEPGPEDALPGFHSGRIRYIRLERNEGIAGNTNQALPHAAGDYIGLLDHDDVLTPDALYEMAAAIGQAQERGTAPALLYSDEDKCNGDRTEYFEPHRKEDFNFDLLLSNNYICHFLVMERALMQELGFRSEYDGAQDFDLVLRAVAGLKGREEAILHIPRVLYHWRCHPGSTAENPESKRHAYEAGRRAVQDFADRQGWAAKAVDTAHVGFYALRYGDGPLVSGRPNADGGPCTSGSPYAGGGSNVGESASAGGSIFDSRTDVGAIAGRIVHSGRVAGGRLAEAGEHVSAALPGREGSGTGPVQAGEVLYRNLPIHYSGYLHRAVLPQDAAAADIRNIRVRPECRELFSQVTGVPYRTVPGTDRFDASTLPEGCDIGRISLELGRALREAGYRILYLPERSYDVEA